MLSVLARRVSASVVVHSSARALPRVACAAPRLAAWVPQHALSGVACGSRQSKKGEAPPPPPAPRQAPAAPVAPVVEDPRAQFDEFNDEEYDEQDDDDYDGSGYGSRAPPAPLAVQQKAPQFEALAVVDGKIVPFESASTLGSWHVLFFYPLDFTFVCPTEIRAFSDRIDEFKALDTKVTAVSVDSEYSHLAWTRQARKDGGLGPMKIPLVADITKKISRRYGVLLEEKGFSLRGLFIIDPQGVVRQITINDLPIGRSVDETLRLVQALQFHEQHGDVCPVGWKPGQETMKDNDEGLKKYFASRK